MDRVFSRHWARFVAAALPVGMALPAFGISCMTQSQMPAAQRTGSGPVRTDAGGERGIGQHRSGSGSDHRSRREPVWGIAASIQQISTPIQHAMLTSHRIRCLSECDRPEGCSWQSISFCGVAGSALTVEVTIPNLPPGKYALAIVHG